MKKSWLETRLPVELLFVVLGVGAAWWLIAPGCTLHVDRGAVQVGSSDEPAVVTTQPLADIHDNDVHVPTTLPEFPLIPKGFVTVTVPVGEGTNVTGYIVAGGVAFVVVLAAVILWHLPPPRKGRG